MKTAVLLLSCLLAFPALAQPDAVNDECSIRSTAAMHAMIVHNAHGTPTQAMEQIRRAMPLPAEPKQKARSESVLSALVGQVFDGLRGYDPFKVSREYLSACQQNPEKFIRTQITR